MIKLFEGCYCSDFKVSPKNWNKPSASTAKDWRIYYRFYDPLYDNPKFVEIKGMNRAKDLQERREVTRDMLEAVRENMVENGWNPLRNVHMKPVEFESELDPKTPMVEALKIALSKVDGVGGTINDITSVVKGVTKAAKELKYDKIPIAQVTLKYYKSIFNQISKTNRRFSSNRQNMYRAYLMKIYKELLQMEAVEYNYPSGIARKEVLKKERVMLSDSERSNIDKSLKNNHYYFWRAIHIFYKSGARETELVKVQRKHIDLEGQSVLYTVLKGRSREVRRPIQDDILPLWTEIVQECKTPDDYIFSRWLIPGQRTKHIRPDQLGRRWNKYVKAPKDKGGMGIAADLYSLKHLHTTEAMDEMEKLSNESAKEITGLTGHTSTAMVENVYDQKSKTRKHDKLKKLSNKFSNS